MVVDFLKSKVERMGSTFDEANAGHVAFIRPFFFFTSVLFLFFRERWPCFCRATIVRASSFLTRA